MKSYYFNFFSLLVIAALGVIVYSNTFHSPFHYDDRLFIVDNHAIRDIQDLPNIWRFYPCRFMVLFSIALNYHCHQLDVSGYHLFNIAVHLCSAFLVWGLVLLTLSVPAMKKDTISGHARLIALLAGLVFVSHPVQTEAVTYIWQRSSSMAALFYLASLCFYVKSRLLSDTQSSGRGISQRIYYIGAALTAMAAMFTKETAITLPLMILLYEFTFLKDQGPWNWKPLLPFLLSIFVIPLTTLLTHSQKVPYIQGSVNVPGGMSSMQYILTQFRVMWTYIRLDFLPFNQNLDYDYHISKSIFELPTLLSFLFLIVVLLAAQRLFSKHRFISFSILWFFLALIPEAMPFPIKDVIFEHRLYLPLAGYSMFLVSSAYYLFGKNMIKVMVIALTAIIACNSFLTYQRNKIWMDDMALWNDTIQKSPHKARPYYNRGDIYQNQGNFSQALSDYTKAIDIDPTFVQAYNNRGLIYDNQGDFSGAISDYNKAIEIDPQHVLTYNDRGNLYGKQGLLTLAIFDYNKAIEIDPQYAQAYNNRGATYRAQGNFVQAVSDFTKAIEIDPHFAQAYDNRAEAYFQLKEDDKAWADVHQFNILKQAYN